MGEFDQLIEMFGPMMGMSAEQIEETKATAAKKEAEDRAYRAMTRRTYKLMKALHPKEMEDIINAEKAGQAKS